MYHYPPFEQLRPEWQCLMTKHYCAKKHANSEVQKPTDVCIFLLPSIIFADLLAT